MNKIWMYAFATAMMIGLSGCGSDNGTTGAGGPTGTTVSGNTFTIDGVWKSACYASGALGSPDQMDTITFAGATVHVVGTNYPSTNLSCTGTATTLGNFDADVTTGATEAIIGWETIAGTVATAPMAKDGSGLLPSTASFTQSTITVTAVSAGLAGNVTVGDVIDVSMVVDDTAPPVIGYAINYAIGASKALTDDFITQQ